MFLIGMATLKLTYLDSITANFTKRFPDEDAGVLSKFDILNPTSEPKVKTQLKEYGSEQITILWEHYQQYIPDNCDSVVSKLQTFVAMVHQNYSTLLTGFQVLASLVFEYPSVPFPSVAILPNSSQFSAFPQQTVKGDLVYKM